MSDEQLVAGVKAGKSNAFNALFLRWYPQVYKFINSLIKDDVLSEDLSQQVFMKVWLYRERLDPSKSLKNYLFVMSRNAALDVFQAKRHLLRVDIPAPADKADNKRTEHLAEYAETQSRILRAVQDMPQQRALIFRMSRFEQMPSDEIADKLGISVRTVERHLYLALQDLRKFLN